MSEPVRFLHAADLHLERPLGGLTEVPPHWRTRCAEAPLTAAAKAFDRARDERCEFVVLSGDVIDPDVSGLRLLTWLNTEFEKLEAAGIRVYWSSGESDSRRRWPRGWSLPPNVVRFGGSKPAAVVHASARGSRLTILGSGARLEKDFSAIRYAGKSSGASRVIVAHGTIPSKRMVDSGPDYWALGGRHQPWRKAVGRSLWRNSGTTQARSASEASPHGATLVEWDGEERFAIRSLTCDAVRYRVEHLAIDGDWNPERLEQQMRQRLDLAIKEAGRPLLVWWKLRAAPHAALRSSTAAARALQGVRQSHGAASVPAWSVAIDFAPPESAFDTVPAESAAADYLRELDGLTAGKFVVVLAGDAVAGLGDACRLWAGHKREARRRHWRQEAARLGLELLQREPHA